MTVNHLPNDLLPIRLGDTVLPGIGFGLNFGVVTDRIKAGGLMTEHSFFFNGAAATKCWVDPAENLVGLLMLQHLGLEEPIGPVFENLVYQAIED